jgi:hypothetical protein
MPEEALIFIARGNACYFINLENPVLGASGINSNEVNP